MTTDRVIWSLWFVIVATFASAQSAEELPAAARLALPGEMHARLEPLVGEWKIMMKVWPEPDAEPVTSDALTATREWLLGGRYLLETLEGTFAGQPSNRLAVLSYNNLEGRFELTTLDTFEPGQMWYRSLTDGSADLIGLVGESTEAGNGLEPTGRKRDMRFEVEIRADSSVERIYIKYPGQDEFLFVEQTFTRC